MDTEGEEILEQILDILAGSPGMGFNDLLKHIREKKPATSPRRLTKILRFLVGEGRVERNVSNSWPPSSQYSAIPNCTNKKPANEKEVRLDKFCPICLESRLRARITEKTITMKCQDERCPVGGDIEVAPFYLKGANPSPNWEDEGLDVYDLVHQMLRAKLHRQALEYWSDTCTNCNTTNVKVLRSGPMFSKECADCGYSPGGVPITAWSIPEGVTFLRSHNKVRDGWVTHPTKVDETACWTITHFDTERNHKLTIYADHKTFQPIRLVIDYKPKPLMDEKTAQQLVTETLV